MGVRGTLPDGDDTDASQRRPDRREVRGGLRALVQPGVHWRWMPDALPLWSTVQQQTHCWLAAGCFAAIGHDLSAILRQAEGRQAEGRQARPRAALVDRQTRHWTPERGAGAGSDGAPRTTGSTVHGAVDTRGHLLALHVTPATAPDRVHVPRPAEVVQEATGETVTLLSVDQGSAGERLLPPRRQAATWRWSRIRRAAADASCCCAAGMWRDCSRGGPAAAGWCVTTSACRPPALVSGSSPAPASPCAAPPQWCSTYVHGRL